MFHQNDNYFYVLNSILLLHKTLYKCEILKYYSIITVSAIRYDLAEEYYSTV